MLAASTSADYQDISVALVLRRAFWHSMGSGRGKRWEYIQRACVPLPGLFPPIIIPSSWVLGTFFLLPVIHPLRAVSQCWKFQVPVSHGAPRAEGGKGVEEERVEKVANSGHGGPVEGSLKFRKLRQGLRGMDATCPFCLGCHLAG